MGDAEAAGFDPKQGHAHVGLVLPEALPELQPFGVGVKVPLGSRGRPLDLAAGVFLGLRGRFEGGGKGTPFSFAFGFR